MLRFPVALLAAMLFNAVAAGAPPPADKERIQEFERLADLALAAPPELGADVLIRLSEASTFAETKWRIDLLETAFQLSSSARFPYQLVGAVGPAGHTDSDAGVRSRALSYGLDTLSLRARVVTAMLPLDPERAMRLFEAISPPQVGSLSCEDALRPTVTRYYVLVRMIAEHGYSPEDRRDGRHLELLGRQIHGLSSPLQLQPVGRLVVESRLDAREFEQLVQVFAGALKRISADDRSFTAGTRHGFTQVFYSLIKKSEGLGISPASLLDAYRSYLARHFGGPRCADSADFRKEGAVLANIVQLFNSSLNKLGPELGEVARLLPEDLIPASANGTARVYHFWAKAETKNLLAELKDLRFGTPEQQAENNKKPPRSDRLAQFLTVEQRQEPAWESKVRQFMREVDAWKREHGESEENYFHQTSLLYSALFELIPPGALRSSVLSSYIGFLRSSPLERANPPEWLMQLRRILNQRDSSPGELEFIREQLRTAGSPTMVLYASLESNISGTQRNRAR